MALMSVWKVDKPKRITDVVSSLDDFISITGIKAEIAVIALA